MLYYLKQWISEIQGLIKSTTVSSKQQFFALFFFIL